MIWGAGCLILYLLLISDAPADLDKLVSKYQGKIPFPKSSARFRMRFGDKFVSADTSCEFLVPSYGSGPEPLISCHIIRLMRSGSRGETTEGREAFRPCWRTEW